MTNVMQTTVYRIQNKRVIKS